MSDKIISIIVKGIGACLCILAMLLTAVMTRHYDECVEKGLILQPVPYYFLMWLNIIFIFISFLTIMKSIEKTVREL